MNKPKEVSAVLKALQSNGKKAGLPASLAGYASYRDGEWIVGANFEDGSSSLVFRNGEWFYRNPFTGSDTPCRGGFSEAMANTECWFTG